MSYVVRTAEFEGPLDVLASLIHKRKLLINDISLAQVTEGYIAYINTLDATPLDNISDFISIASTLLLVKSKSLLPHMHLSYEEEASIDELKERLKSYEVLKSCASHLVSSQKNKRIYLPDRSIKRVYKNVDTPSNLTLSNIQKGLHSILSSLPHFFKSPETRIKPIVSLKTIIEKLERTAGSSFSSSFRHVVGDRAEKASVVVNFLALLELVKQGILHAHQGEGFDDIFIESKKIATPRYG